MKCLFIGGPKAGQIREMEHCPRFINFPLPNRTQAKFEHYPLEMEPVSISFVEYALDYATDKSGNRHVLYVEVGSGDALHTLMNFYAEAKHS